MEAFLKNRLRAGTLYLGSGLCDGRHVVFVSAHRGKLRLTRGVATTSSEPTHVVVSDDGPRYVRIAQRHVVQQNVFVKTNRKFFRDKHLHVVEPLRPCLVSLSRLSTVDLFATEALRRRRDRGLDTKAVLGNVSGKTKTVLVRDEWRELQDDEGSLSCDGDVLNAGDVLGRLSDVSWVTTNDDCIVSVPDGVYELYI